MVEVEMLVELVFEIVEKDASYDMIIENETIRLSLLIPIGKKSC
jgi:hypothetical protein